MMHSFAYGSKKALLHLMSLSLLSLHVQSPIYGNVSSDIHAQPNNQVDQPQETDGWYAGNGYRRADYFDQQVDYSTEQVDYSTCWQDPSIDCQDPLYCQNQNQDEDQEQGNCENQPPCEQPQTQTCAQETCENNADACDASAYVEAKKVGKLRPITVVVGILIVGALVVTLMNNSTHQHSARSRACKSGCQPCKSCR